MWEAQQNNIYWIKLMNQLFRKVFQFIALVYMPFVFSIDLLATQSDFSTIILVRHAEKLKDVTDPELSEKGKVRAKQLSIVLKDIAIDRIFSTEYKRTQQTAAPLSEAKSLSVDLYNPKELENFAHYLKTIKGVSMVVGHSNTTTEMVKLLGGDPISSIDDATEFDRIYIITITKDSRTQSLLLRY